MSAPRRYGVRLNAGVRQLIWIDSVRNGFWRGSRLPDGVPTRGPVSALLGRFATEGEARAALEVPA